MSQIHSPKSSPHPKNLSSQKLHLSSSHLAKDPKLSHEESSLGFKVTTSPQGESEQKIDYQLAENREALRKIFFDAYNKYRGFHGLTKGRVGRIKHSEFCYEILIKFAQEEPESATAKALNELNINFKLPELVANNFLVQALINKNLNEFKTALLLGANPNCEYNDNPANTILTKPILEIAINHMNIGAIQLLLQNGATAHHKYLTSCVLHPPKGNNHDVKDLVKILIQYGNYSSEYIADLIHDCACKEDSGVGKKGNLIEYTPELDALHVLKLVEAKKMKLNIGTTFTQISQLFDNFVRLHRQTLQKKILRHMTMKQSLKSFYIKNREVKKILENAEKTLFQKILSQVDIVSNLFNYEFKTDMGDPQLNHVYSTLIKYPYYDMTLFDFE